MARWCVKHGELRASIFFVDDEIAKEKTTDNIFNIKRASNSK